MCIRDRIKGEQALLYLVLAEAFCVSSRFGERISTFHIKSFCGFIKTYAALFCRYNPEKIDVGINQRAENGLRILSRRKKTAEHLSLIHI